MATLFRRPPSSRQLCQCSRAFGTSTIRPVNLQWQYNDPEALADALPAYPFGPTRWYKQSRHGLYGGQRIRFGNNVSDDLEIKTRRSWHPNIKTKKLYSKALARYVQVRVSTRVLKTIDKLGGLDEYLLGEKTARIKELGESGWWLRWAIMQTPAIQKRFAKERAALGLPASALVEGLHNDQLAASETVESAAEELSAEEAAEAIEEGEVLEDDGAVSVDQSDSNELPALRWRVGPGQHLILTAQGWRRVREDPAWRMKRTEEKRKEKAQEKAMTAIAESPMYNAELQGKREEYRRRIEAYNAAVSLNADSGRRTKRFEGLETLNRVFEGRRVQQWEEDALIQDAEAKFKSDIISAVTSKRLEKSEKRIAKRAAKASA